MRRKGSCVVSHHGVRCFCPLDSHAVFEARVAACLLTCCLGWTQTPAQYKAGSNGSKVSLCGGFIFLGSLAKQGVL